MSAETGGTRPGHTGLAMGSASDGLASGPLAGRRVVLGVTGGIAAYKAVELCRRLVDAGAYVIPVLTSQATRFVGAVTFSALASEPAHQGLFDGAEPIPHTVLGRSADLVIVAPATARLIGLYAAGISSDLLTATLLATRAPVVVCPAMHTEMWEHPAVQENLAVLTRRGVVIVGPGTGRLAGGDSGTGRMADPEEIVSRAAQVLGPRVRAGLSGAGSDRTPLRDLRVVVSAGGTREPLDPVRYITNRSSGKQGHAIAEVAHERGASVVLVTSAPLDVPAGIEVVRVETADQMEHAMLASSRGADIVVMAAAVADFRPKMSSPRKLRKSDGVPELLLEPTADILAGLSAGREQGQVLVGFAAETEEVELRAKSKLYAKGVDLIVANDITEPGAGFENDTNAVLIVSAGSVERVPLTTKREVAGLVLDRALSLLSRREPTSG